jgi:uncharacterized protein (DUF1499 family)
MGWLDGLTKNWAMLGPQARDPQLRPIVVTRPAVDALTWTASVIAGLPRWAIVSVDHAAGTLHATHATRVWHFLDDIHLRFEPDPAGTRVTGRSEARVGSGDLGQNARNLRELARALEAAESSLK